MSEGHDNVSVKHAPQSDMLHGGGGSEASFAPVLW